MKFKNVQDTRAASNAQKAQKQKIVTKVIKAFTFWKDIKDILEVPIYPGHAFAWWSLELDGDAIDENYQFLEDTIIYAHYEVVYITITLELNGGECKIDKLRVPQLTDFATVRRELQQYKVHLPGKALDYWSLEAVNGIEIDSEYIFEHSSTIYAYYTDDFITVVFDPMGGDVAGGSDTLRINRYSTWIDLKEKCPNAELVGYEFKYWTTNTDTDEEIQDAYIFQEDIVTLYAVYEKIIVYVDVIFDYDGHQETVNIATGSTLQQAIDMLDGWNKGSGYTHLGWAISRFSQLALNPLTTFINAPMIYYAVYERHFELYLITNSVLNQLYTIPTNYIGSVTLRNNESLTQVFGDPSFQNALKQDYISYDGSICNASGSPVQVTNDLAPGTYYIKYPTPSEVTLSYLVPCVASPSMTSYEYFSDDAATYAKGTCSIPYVTTPSTIKSRIISSLSGALSGAGEISSSELTSKYDVIGLVKWSGDLSNVTSRNFPSSYFSFSNSGNYLADEFVSGSTYILALRYKTTILLNQAPGSPKLRGSNFEFPYCTLRIAKQALNSQSEAGSSGRLYAKMRNTDYDDREDEEAISIGSYDIDSDVGVVYFPTLAPEPIRGISYHAPS